MEPVEFHSLDFQSAADSDTLRLCTLWNIGSDEKKVYVMILFGSKAYTSLVSEDSLRKWPVEIGISFEEYVDCMKHTFTSKWGPKNDTLVIEADELLWQKVFKDFVVTFGCFQLKMENSDFTGLLISSLLDKCQSLEVEVSEMSAKNESLLGSLSEIQEYSQQISKDKNDMEATLYSKFLHLLNEKKEIISRLNSNVHEDY